MSALPKSRRAQRQNNTPPSANSAHHALGEMHPNPCCKRARGLLAPLLRKYVGDDGSSEDRALHGSLRHGPFQGAPLHCALDGSLLHDAPPHCALNGAPLNCAPDGSLLHGAPPHCALHGAPLHSALDGSLLHGAPRCRSLDRSSCHLRLLSESRNDPRATLTSPFSSLESSRQSLISQRT